MSYSIGTHLRQVILLTLPCCILTAGSGRQLFNIADYGAGKDGSASATDAFRQAIQAPKAAGGGTIYVPPRKYTTGPIELFTNITLDISASPKIHLPFS